MSIAKSRRFGIIGCGNVSSAYHRTLHSFSNIEVSACADLDDSRARAISDRFSVPAYSVSKLLDDPTIRIILNLTPPSAHFGVTMAALRAGKSVYSEKPLATSRQEAEEILSFSEARSLGVGCAPDTFMGASLQTCRSLIDGGAIGTPIGATAFFMSHGHESWHPNPGFFYVPGAGPLFDMGPYYLTALIFLLGPICGVSGLARIGVSERVITGPIRTGERILVEAPTHIVSVVEFTSGVLCNLAASFDVWASALPHAEIYGTAGTLSVPDPNCFGGEVRLFRAGEDAWKTIALMPGYTENCRGIGAVDLIAAIDHGAPPRACARMAYHVLDAMLSISRAAAEKRFIELQSTCERPRPLSPGIPIGESL